MAAVKTRMPSNMLASALHDDGDTMIIAKREYRAAWRPGGPLEPDWVERHDPRPKSTVAFGNC